MNTYRELSDYRYFLVVVENLVKAVEENNKNFSPYTKAKQEQAERRVRKAVKYIKEKYGANGNTQKKMF